jgi:hypothetical protein
MTTLNQANRTVPWTHWLLRATVTVEGALAVAQSIFIGAFLPGHYDALAWHQANATIVGFGAFTMAAAALLNWRPGGGPVWTSGLISHAARFRPIPRKPRGKDKDGASVASLLPFVRRLAFGRGLVPVPGTRMPAPARSAAHVSPSPEKEGLSTTTTQNPPDSPRAGSQPRRRSSTQPPQHRKSPDSPRAGSQPRRLFQLPEDKTHLAEWPLDLASLLFPDTQPHVTIFGFCQGTLSRLDKTQKS